MHPQRRINLTAVALYLALGTMFSATPRYVTEELGGSKALAGFAVSVFFLAAIITRPIVGRLADRHGRRLFLVIPPFVIAGLLAAMLGAKWIPLVLLIRFAQGVAGSTFYTAAVTASTDLAPGRQASAVATLSVGIYLGFAVGPALGEQLLDLGTTWAWLVPAAIAVVAGLAIASIPETRPSDEATGDDTAAVFAETAPGVTGAAGPVGHLSPARPASGEPTRLIGKFLHPAAILPGLTLLTLGMGYTAITSQSALYARSIGLESSTLLFAVYSIAILLVRLVSGRLADNVGPVKVMFPGTATLTAGLFCLALFDLPVTAVIGVALVGTGWALVFPAVTAWLATHVPDAERGVALGSLIAFMDVGQATAGYAIGAVADVTSFGTAFLVPAVATVAGGVVLAIAVRRAGPPIGTVHLSA